MSLISGHTIGYFWERPRYLRQLKKRFKRVEFIPHHLAHAASSFRASGFDRANVIVTDGLGEKYGTSLFIGDGNNLTPILQLDHNYSLGFYYKTITFLLNFGYFGDGKTMGLSGYGELKPEFEKIMDVGNGWYKPNHGLLRELGKYRRTNNNLLDVHRDLAAAVQNGLEKAVQEMLRVIYARTKSSKLCMAGGVALNCTMNGELLGNTFIDEIFVQPAAMDAGTSLGAALEAYAKLGFESKTSMKHPYLGPEFSNDQVEHELKKWPFEYRKQDNIIEESANLLANGEIIGWFQGRLEFGPRALGNRRMQRHHRS
jgi:carbamoyltransferase